jgi:hypothetical protein
MCKLPGCGNQALERNDASEDKHEVLINGCGLKTTILIKNVITFTIVHSKTTSYCTIVFSFHLGVATKTFDKPKSS